ncbi:hypothetical protein [Mycobacterium sp. GA-2829]|uniref:hypothetical protein n=1 Tax=Mycobacterium sp. GA-2829 TaxID=1772283 RepID=UPI0007405148|nr:hypothetical protein [Mycobacterium sp. GA-2829]KUI29230.1 hypothetical protein AU194_20330 [Mycobacterium sp. GA-2829]
MSQDPVAPIPPEEMLGPSDWDDEDLLTVVEASERLVEEIKASRERIRQAEEVLADGANTPATEAAGVDAERKRLEELIRAAERIKAAQANAPR